MSTVRVHTLRADYHLAAHESVSRARLDGLLATMAADALASELDDIAGGELVFLRRVSAPVRLDLDAGDGALVRAWARAIGDAAREAVAAAGTDVVRYGSRHHALLDLALGVAAGDLRRAWAWERMGIWDAARDAPPPGEQAQRALATQPGAIVAILARVARTGGIPMLARLIGADGLAWLTHRARASARPAGWASSSDRSPHGLAVLLVGHSAIAASIASVLPQPDGGPARAATLVELALLEAGVAEAGCEPARVAAAIRGLTAGDAVAASAREPAAEGTRPAEDRAAPPEDVVVEPAPRPASTTDHGGLLLVLSLYDPLRGPAILADGALDGRGARWRLHALGCELARCEPADAAALAFAGLAPDVEPPAQLDPPTQAERRALRRHGRNGARRLRRLLRRDDMTPRAVLDAVCRRPAMLIVDPGWIEAHLPLDCVELDLRRTGLDADPNWLPWLGATVKVIYD